MHKSSKCTIRNVSVILEFIFSSESVKERNENVPFPPLKKKIPKLEIAKVGDVKITNK